MAITIKQIAAQSGFSPSTVSHAISGRNPGKRPLSPQTVAHIREVAEELGYRPNMLAAGLAQNRTFAVGVLVAMLRGDFYQRILEGIAQVVYPEFSPLLAVHNYDFERECRELDLFIGKRVDGVIAACSGSDESVEVYRALERNYRMPLVLVDRGLKGLNCPVVRGDHEKTSYLATRELQRMGHKHIVYATAGARMESTDLFKLGYASAMQESGYQASILHPAHATWTKEITHQLACEIVHAFRSRQPAPTAFICQADWLAYEVLAECDRQGIRVPDDFSVMGLQDCEPSELPAISLSTMRVRMEDVGQKAAEVLINLIDGAEPDENPTLIEPSLVLRRTTRQL